MVNLPLDGSPLPAGAADVGPVTTVADGPGGPATRLTGGSAVGGGDVAAFDRADAFSYGAWVRLRSPGGSPVSRMAVADAFRGFDIYMEGDRPCVHLIHRWPDDAIKVRSTVPAPVNHWHHLFATYDGSGRAAGVRLYVDGRAVPVEVMTDALEGSIRSRSPLLVGTRDGGDPIDGDVADARVYGRALSAAEVVAVADGPGVRRLLAAPADRRTPADAHRLSAYAAAIDPELSVVRDGMGDDRRSLTKIASEVGDTMVMEDLPRPRDTFVLLRGEYDKHGDRVEPGTPAVLPPLPKDAPPNRLGLARWVVSPDNPLTSRVLVNRLWERLFGVGLVKTSENLGVQAEWPSNPQLLDWLAVEMLALHWDQKAFQRELVLSATYRQASAVTPDLIERDPDNRLLARGPRFRLPAETIRDQALAVAGLLVERVGGPSVRPYAPANLWAGNLYGNLKQYRPSPGPDLYRRSVYTFLKRTAPPPAMSTFDQPTREYCVIRRSRTDTPVAGPGPAGRPDVRRGRPRVGRARDGHPRPGRVDVRTGHLPPADGRRAAHPDRRVRSIAGQVPSRPGGGGEADGRRCQQGRPQPRPGHAGRVHDDGRRDPEPRRDGHQAVSDLGKAGVSHHGDTEAARRGKNRPLLPSASAPAWRSKFGLVVPAPEHEMSVRGFCGRARRIRISPGRCEVTRRTGVVRPSRLGPAGRRPTTGRQPGGVQRRRPRRPLPVGGAL